MTVSEFRRLTLTSLVVEVFGIAALLLAVPLAYFEAATLTNLQANLQWHGRWIGAVAGFAFCLAGGWWIAWRGGPSPVRAGTRLGTAVAALDLLALMAAGAPIGWTLFLSVAGRQTGGYVGGRLASSRRRATA